MCLQIANLSPITAHCKQYTCNLSPIISFGRTIGGNSRSINGRDEGSINTASESNVGEGREFVEKGAGIGNLIHEIGTLGSLRSHLLGICSQLVFAPVRAGQSVIGWCWGNGE